MRRDGSGLASTTTRSHFGPTPRRSLGFPRGRRIRKRSDFSAVYDGGTRVGTRFFALFVLRTGSGAPGRVGFTVTRKIGNAVVRSRCRRLLREAVRRHWSLLPDSVDMVLHARPGLAEAQTRDVEKAIVRMLPKAIRRLA